MNDLHDNTKVVRHDSEDILFRRGELKQVIVTRLSSVHSKWYWITILLLKVKVHFCVDASFEVVIFESVNKASKIKKRK
jgi:hypothetical protein